MRLKGFVLGTLILFSYNLVAQNIRGVVLDAYTNQPIESASVYFDNTTIGTSTNDKGEFEIQLKEGVTSALVISFLGYEKVLLDTYNSKQFYKIVLNESADSLDEVVIYTDDGMPKAIKLQQFREQFLGFSKFAKSCMILNEDALILRFDQDSKQLSVSATEPVIVQNNSLQYQVNFDIIDFVIDYSYIDVLRGNYQIKSMLYSGTSFYKPLENDKPKQAEKNREQVYKGSVLHFMRALTNKRLKKDKYFIFSKGFRVDPNKYISVSEVGNTDSFNVKLRAPLSVLYKREFQSEIELPLGFKQKISEVTITTNDTLKRTIQVKGSTSNAEPYYNVEFIVDSYGNYSPIDAFYFIGYMGNQRVGDSLPFDYELP